VQVHGWFFPVLDVETCEIDAEKCQKYVEVSETSIFGEIRKPVFCLGFLKDAAC
jgi:hypothetical protein